MICSTESVSLHQLLTWLAGVSVQHRVCFSLMYTCSLMHAQLRLNGKQSLASPPRCLLQLLVRPATLEPSQQSIAGDSAADEHLEPSERHQAIQRREGPAAIEMLLQNLQHRLKPIVDDVQTDVLPPLTDRQATRPLSSSAHETSHGSEHTTCGSRCPPKPRRLTEHITSCSATRAAQILGSRTPAGYCQRMVSWSVDDVAPRK
jgi:hypothetical protein